MPSDATRVRAERTGDVLVLRLCAPQRRNAIDTAFTAELASALSTGTDDVGAVALLADGDHFCVGGDIREMAAAADRQAFVGALADGLHRSLASLREGPPVLVGWRGWAAGAGMSLVCAADLVVAGESATLQPAYPSVGLSPDGGLTWTLPRVVGSRRARSILLRNTVIDAATAADWGIADEVVPDEEVESATLALAQTVAAGPRSAQQAVKRLVAQADRSSFADQLDAEAASIGACAGSADGLAGITAFLERRAAVFGGS
jgi:2-(1,2-epoxy-1,2-dihydrophenyl)acetyl-CoA isomerase